MTSNYNDPESPLLGSDSPHNFISKHITDADSYPVRLRRFLQWFLPSKFGHYFVIILVTLDVAGIFADFIISLHMCEHSSEDMRLWKDIDDTLDVVSLVFSCLFMLELCASIYAFGLGYFKSKFHVFDASAILASFIVDVCLHGIVEEAGSLIIILRLFRVFKIVEESSTVAEESLEQLNERIEMLEKENEMLRTRSGYQYSTS